MPKSEKIRIFSTHGQVVVVLLYVLSCCDSDEPKQRIIHLIRAWRLLALESEDMQLYRSVEEIGRTEPRWETLVAFAKLHCNEHAWLYELGHNRWQVNEKGRNVFDRLKQRCAERTVNVRNGYFWTNQFKKILLPGFEPSQEDAKRPLGSIYKDTRLAILLDELV